jgi:hypothetical protein
VHKGIKGGADGLGDLGAGPLVLALKCHTDRAQSRDEADQLRLGQGAPDVDRLEADVGPATRLEDGNDPLRVGKGELSRAVRRGRGKVRQQRGRLTQAGRHERIFRGAAPGDDVKRGVVGRGTPQVREGLDRVMEEHDAESRDDRVDACALKGMGL